MRHRNNTVCSGQRHLCLWSRGVDRAHSCLASRRTLVRKAFRIKSRVDAVPSTADSAGKQIAALPATTSIAGTDGAAEALRERLESGSLASSSSSVAEDVTQTKFQALAMSGRTSLTVDEIAAAFSFPLDAFQLQAVGHFLAGRSVLVCAPTGAGKTAIAEAATISVLAGGGRVIYTTPLKALSNQKLQEMRLQFGQDRVGLQTGDVSLNAEGDIVIMTTEVLRNILFGSKDPERSLDASERMQDVRLVVLDEVHYLGDPDRGSVWEEVIISCPVDVPLLCMSATVRNPDDLGGWISQVHGECETVLTDFRPVPLAWEFCYGGSGAAELLPLLAKSGAVRLNPDFTAMRSAQEDVEEHRGFGQSRFGRRRRVQVVEQQLDLPSPSVAEAVEALRARQLLPCIWFAFSRRGCDEAAIAMHEQGVALTVPEERQLISRVLEALRDEQPEAVREEMVGPLLQGLASHHAGCLPAWKALIELLFQQGVIKIVFATGTLAAGLNMPARSTVISALSRRSGAGHLQLAHNELIQMAGRAGRRGFDSCGHCVVLQERYSGPEDAVEILRRGPEPLRSQFATGYGMVLKLLHHRSLESAREFVLRSFHTYLAEEGVKKREKAIQDAEAEAEGLLARAAAAEAAAGGSERTYATYLDRKHSYTAMRHEMRKAMRAACRARGAAAAEKLEKAQLPAVVGLEYATLDLADETQIVAALLITWDERQSDPEDKGETPDDQGGHLCLTVDNRLFLVQPKHIAAISNAELAFSEAELKPIHSAAAAVRVWQPVKSGSYMAEGTARTAGIAAKIRADSLEIVSPGAEELQRVDAVQEAMEEARYLAKSAQKGANKAKSFREDLRLRAEATKVRRRAKELRAALQATTARKETNWKAFESTVEVLVKAGALERDTLEATPLGQVAREINSDNELWMATVLTHASSQGCMQMAVDGRMCSGRMGKRLSIRGLRMGKVPLTTCLDHANVRLVSPTATLQALQPPQLAGVISAMVAGNFTKPYVSATYTCSDAVLEAVESMETEREELYYLQQTAGVEASLIVDVRLSGIAEAWAAGLGWEQVTKDCTLDSGDIARLLSRTADLLRQASRTSSLLPQLRECARKAASAMQRNPITDLVQ